MRKLDEGDYNVVYSARRVQSMQNSLVAIKMWKKTCSSQEIDIMRYLGGCNENCVMPMVDACVSASLTAIVMPLCDRSLQQLFEGQVICTNSGQLSIARGVAKGLAYMHCKKILHLNLDASKIMLTELDSDFRVYVSNFDMVASMTEPFGEPSFSQLHQRWYRAPELFIVGSLQVSGLTQRIVFHAPLLADIKPLLGPAVDVWAFGILLCIFPAPFSLGCHPFMSGFPKEVDESWHIVSSLFAWLGMPAGDSAFLRRAKEHSVRGAVSMPLGECSVSDVLTQVFIYERRPTMQNIVECLAA